MWITADRAPGPGTPGAELSLVPESSREREEDRGTLCSFLLHHLLDPAQGPCFRLIAPSPLGVLCKICLLVGLLEHPGEPMRDNESCTIMTHTFSHTWGKAVHIGRLRFGSVSMSVLGPEGKMERNQ